MASLWELMAAREDMQMSAMKEKQAQFAENQRQRDLQAGMREAVDNRPQQTTFAPSQQTQPATLAGLAPSFQADPSLTEITGRVQQTPEQASYEYLRTNDPLKAQDFAASVLQNAKGLAMGGDHRGAVDYVNKSLGTSIEYVGSKGTWMQLKNHDGTMLLYNPETEEERVIGTPYVEPPPEPYKIGTIQDFQNGRTKVYKEYAGKGQWKDRPDLGTATIDKPVQPKVVIQGGGHGGGRIGMPTAKPPVGYRYTAEGELEPIPGGPASQKVVTAAKAQEGAVQSIGTAIDAARSLLNHPGRKAATGGSSLFNAAAVPGGARKTFLNDLETFKSQMFIPMVQQMKGMGQLSDAEGKKLLAAVGNLETTSSEAAFTANLNKVIQGLEQTLARTSQPIATGPSGKQPARNGKSKVRNAGYSDLLNKYRK